MQRHGGETARYLGPWKLGCGTHRVCRVRTQAEDAGEVQVIRGLVHSTGRLDFIMKTMEPKGFPPREVVSSGFVFYGP